LHRPFARKTVLRVVIDVRFKESIHWKVIGILSGILAAVFLPVLCLAVIGHATDLPAADEVQEASKELARIEFTVSGSEKASFYYNDAMLLDRMGISEPSGELALASVALAVSAYDKDNVEEALTDMGYRVLVSSPYYTQETTHADNDVAAFTLAEKYVQYRGELYRILLLPVRGTPSSCEWYSDLKLGCGSGHAGFHAAADKILSELKNHISSACDASHTLLWTVGHSRGAAVANIIAGTVSTASEWQERINRNGVFGYTFACPAVSTAADSSLTNIFNYNNGGDVVPALPLADWGYRRFGQTIVLPASDYDNLRSRYQQETSEEYTVPMTTLSWEQVLKKLAPTAEDFSTDDKLCLATEIIAWLLGGYTDESYTLLDIMLAHPCAMVEVSGEVMKAQFFPASTLASFKYDMTAAALQGIFDSDLQTYFALETELGEAIVETAGMSDVDSEDASTHEKYLDWCRWYSNHTGWFLSVEEYTGVHIERIADISHAHSIAGSRYEDYKGFLSTFRDVFALFFDNNGNPVAPFTQGHPQLTYLLWVNSLYYGYRGWYENPSLTAVNWKGRVQKTYVGDQCFSGCTALLTVTETEPIQLMAEAFSHCPGMKEATFSADGIVIGREAFFDCGALKRVTFSGENIIIGQDAFCDCDALTDIVFSGSGTVVGDCAFSSCDGLTALVIPNHIGKLLDGAFYACSSLAELTAPYEASYYGEPGLHGFFGVCDNLKKLTVTKGRTGEYREGEMISPWAVNTDTLEHIIVEEGVRSIGPEAFTVPYGHGIKLRLLELPASLEQIAEGTFKNMRYASEAQVVFHGTLADWCAIDFADATAQPLWSMSHDLYAELSEVGLQIGGEQISDLVIPAGIRAIHPYAFYGCQGLKSLTVSGETEIGEEAFFSCRNLTGATFAGNGITIGREAFYNCGALKNVTFSGENIVIGDRAFEDCDALTDIDFSGSGTVVGCYAFSSCDALAALVIPNHIGKLLDGAFYACSSLAELTAPYEASYYGEPGLHGFFGVCDNLKKLTVTKGRTGEYREGEMISPWAVNTDTLEHIIVEEGVRSIGPEAFTVPYGHGIRLRLLELPASLERVAEGTFQNVGYASEAQVVFHGTLADWCAIDFADATANPLYQANLNDGDGGRSTVLIIDGSPVTAPAIPEGVTKVKQYAFENCGDLEWAFIPATVSEIAANAFLNCENMKHVFYAGDESKWSEIIAKDEDSELSDVTVHFDARYAFRAGDLSDESLTAILSDDGLFLFGDVADAAAVYAAAYDKNGRMMFCKHITGEGSVSLERFDKLKLFWVAAEKCAPKGAAIEFG